MASYHTFPKIKGYKRIIICKICRKKFFSEKEKFFCEDCEKRVRKKDEE